MDATQATFHLMFLAVTSSTDGGHFKRGWEGQPCLHASDQSVGDSWWATLRIEIYTEQYQPLDSPKDRFLVLALWVHILKYVDNSVVWNFTSALWYEIKTFSEFLPSTFSFFRARDPLLPLLRSRELSEDEFMSLLKGVYSKSDRHMSGVQSHCTVECWRAGSLEGRPQAHNVPRLL